MKPSLTFLATAAAAAALLASIAGASADAPAPSLAANTGLNWHETPAQLTATCNTAIAQAKQQIGSILAQPSNASDFKTSIAALETAMADLSDRTTAQTTLNQLSPDKAVRDASTDCNQKVSDYDVEVSADPRIYAAAQKVTANGSAKTIADRKLVEYYLINGRRSGAGLDDAKRKQVTQLFQHLNDLERDFALTLSNDATTIAITNIEALSLPASFVSTLRKTTAGYVVPVNESTYDQYMSDEKSSAARKRFLIAYGNRGGLQNVQRLQAAIGVRDQLAHLLGFKDWAAYQLDVKMAKTPERAEALLTRLDRALLPKAREEVRELAALKHSRGDAKSLNLGLPLLRAAAHQERYGSTGGGSAGTSPSTTWCSAYFDLYAKLLGVRFVGAATTRRLGAARERVRHHG